jgi:hypothetical protein
LQSQGFAPAHLAAWSSRERFEHSTNKVGLLITMAREFATRSEGFAFGCLRCFGDGLADGKPCTCPEGVKEAAIIDLKAKRAKADLEAKQAEDAKKAHDKPFMDRSICPKCEGAAGGCKSCNGTGVWRSTDAWRALGLCWMCSGTGRMGSRPCICCKGSGKNPRAFDSNGTAVGAELREA